MTSLIQNKDELIPRRRNELKIMTEILSNTTEPIRLTLLVYRTNLNYRQTRKYLSTLRDMGFINTVSKGHRTYVITEKGRAFLHLVTSEQTLVSAMPTM